jgi:hypothetical protein
LLLDHDVILLTYAYIVQRLKSVLTIQQLDLLLI